MQAIPPLISGPPPTGNEKLWSILSHLSSLMGVPILLPLAVWLAMRGDSEFTAANAKEALNFHISFFIYIFCCVPLAYLLIGIPLILLLGAASFVFAIIAAIKASEGRTYHYPLTLHLVK